MTTESTQETIVVATDHSEAANAATRWAAAFAKQRNAKILLVRSFDPGVSLIPPDSTLPMPTELVDQLQDAAREQLEQATAQLRKEGVLVEPEFAIGAPANAVIDVAKKAGAEMIVAGTRGLSGFLHLLLGSTAEQIVEKSPIPVLTIHPDTPPPGAIARILVPTDFSGHAQAAVQAAERMLGRLPAEGEIILFHAYHLPVELTALAGSGPILPSYIEDIAAAANERLQELAKQLSQGRIRVETVLREGYPPQLIVDEAKARKVDLIAMGTHGHSMLKRLVLGTTVERVLKHAPCPVLTAHRP